MTPHSALLSELENFDLKLQFISNCSLTLVASSRKSHTMSCVVTAMTTATRPRLITTEEDSGSINSIRNIKEHLNHGNHEITVFALLQSKLEGS